LAVWLAALDVCVPGLDGLGLEALEVDAALPVAGWPGVVDVVVLMGFPLMGFPFISVLLTMFPFRS
jgi:hypothetical protein